MNTHKPSPPKKVLVSGHDLKFWRPLQEHLQATGLFEFREDEWTGHNEHDPKQTLDGIAWADIIVAEWTLGNAVFCSKHKKKNQRLVTRLHLQERGTEYPAQIDYNNVDLLIFVGSHIQEECITKFNIPRHKTCVIGNFLDQKKFYLPKFGGSEYNLGIIGTVPSRKRFDLALDTLEELLKKDERYMLHVKGPSPQNYEWLWARTKERKYYEEIYARINSNDVLRYKVVFDPPGNDVHRWFQKIGFILSPSDFESFHMAVAEGMCSGAIPVVWNWDGANTIYPFLELFDQPQNAANFIHMMATSKSRSRFSEQGVNFIKEHYDASVISDKWVEALNPTRKSENLSSKVQHNKKSVVIVYSIDSWETFHRREMLEALARHLRDDFDMLIIEPGTHYGTLLNKNLCSKEELDSYARLKPVQLTDNIYKIRLLLGHIPKGVVVDGKLSAAVSQENAIQVAAKEIFGYNIQLIHWLYKPNHRAFVPEGQKYVYEVYDEYTLNFGTGEPIQEMVDMEPGVLESASHVFFTSKPLAMRKKANCRSWSVVGNGAAFEEFDKYSIKVQEVSNLRPVVGYLGNLSDFFDWNLIGNVAEKLPEVDFFFHGQVEFHKLSHVIKDVERLMGLPNTYFSGRVTRPVGAAAINRYDVLIIPFVVNDAMHAVNPLKLWEYLSVGLPIIMTPMDAVTNKIPNLVIANNVPEWVNGIRNSLGCNIELNRRAKEYSKNYSWSKITENHGNVIKKIAML